MEKVTLAEIQNYIGGVRNGGALVSAVSIDSRKISRECLFFGIKGENFDGNDFIEMAIQNRAMAIVTNRDVVNATVIKVEDPNQALLDFAHGYRRKFLDLQSVSVTGSVGKTTTKEMIYGILCKMGRALKNEGNLNNQFGVPLTVFNLDRNHKYAVFELGMNHRGEIKPLAEIVYTDVSVITNISISHIENLGSREEIAKEKLDILHGTKSVAVLNGDEPLLRNLDTDKEVVYFGLESENLDVTADKIFNFHNKSMFRAIIGNRIIPITINFAGKHNIMNALAAIAATVKLGATDKQIQDGLLEFRNADMRQNIYMYNGFKVIEDCYNASSPDSMKASIDLISYMNEKRKILVLGNMAELGEFSRKAHIEVLEQARKISKDIFLYGEEWTKIDAKEIPIFDDKYKLAEEVKKKISIDTAVLIKGSRSTKMEDVINYIKE